MQEEETQKSPRAQKEEKTLAFWKEHSIFEKTLEKKPQKGEFIFYEGPPTANAKPALHHLISRAFKDVMPRYKTMQGYFVRRKAGWDTHGLPVELQVEKALGFTSKKDIEEYGVAAFNAKCRENVWQNIGEWESFTERIGYWVDQKNPYITYTPEYMESLWWIMSEVDKRGLLYKDYRIVPWCPRCGTALSSHELAQGYAEVKDPSIYVKFKIVGEENTYFLVWTTTPWTLPSNLALAVGKDIDYVTVKKDSEYFILAKNKIELVGENVEIIEEIKGKDLVSKKYEPLFDFLKNDANENSFKVYAGDFVSTEDGTGIVHIAPMYGQDDFELATKNNIPKKHLVGDDGNFLSETKELAGKFVKDTGVNIEIIKDLAARHILFKNGTATHTYPFCWRCKTPLLYYARDSWYIAMSKLRDELIAENKKINWEPKHLQDGRFGEWLREVKDWAISRERYWGTPLPVWVSKDGDKKVISSVNELKKYTKKNNNTFIFLRHGQSESNVKGICNSDVHKLYPLTEKGKKQIHKRAKSFKGRTIDVIVTSPFLRAKETAEIIAEEFSYPKENIIVDNRVREFDFGDFNEKTFDEYLEYEEKFMHTYETPIAGGESYLESKKRFGEFLYEIDKKHSNKTILVSTHGIGHETVKAIIEGANMEKSKEIIDTFRLEEGGVLEFLFTPLPYNENYELDLHKPYIDEIELEIDGKLYTRVPEVMDVWFDSGAMPFAQDHYPFENEKIFQPQKGFLKKQKGYPADYISEAIDQTRGWFYTLLAVGTLLGYGAPYKNVISLGHILDEKGKKMSKSIGNILDPWVLLDNYGADTLRFWMFTINQPGESKNFDEKTVAEVQRKTIGLLENVVQFYLMYADEKIPQTISPTHVLDRWIYSLYNKLVDDVTKSLDEYKILEAGRAIRDFVGELSQWYLRRSRDRFRGDDEADKRQASQTLGFTLLNLSKLMAPFMPFVSEEIYKELNGEKESVHLEEWPTGKKIDKELLVAMLFVRSFATIGLRLRAEKDIKVRQPLQRFTAFNIKHDGLAPKYWEECKAILKDELNVEEVVLVSGKGPDEPSFSFDFNITPELKTKGEVRDLIRAIQDLRKVKGLEPGQKAHLLIKGNPEVLHLVKENKEMLIRATSLVDIATEAGEYELSLI